MEMDIVDTLLDSKILLLRKRLWEVTAATWFFIYASLAWASANHFLRLAITDVQWQNMTSDFLLYFIDR